MTVCDDPPSRQPTLIQSVRRALQLVEIVGERPSRATAKELARVSGMPLPTAYHLLRTLTHEGFLSRLDDGTYDLGPALLAAAEGCSPRRGFGAARRTMAMLRDAVHAPVYLAFLQDGEVQLVEVVDSKRTPRIDLWAELRDSAHATAFGKCILAGMDAPARADYIHRHSLSSLTSRTVTNTGALTRQLEHFRALAFEREEYSVGVACTAAPVRMGDGLGAIAVSRTGVQSTQPDERIDRHLLQAAAEVSRILSLSKEDARIAI